MDLYREFIANIGMFENFRNLATTEQLIKYQNILLKKASPLIEFKGGFCFFNMRYSIHFL